MPNTAIVLAQKISAKIHVLRGHKVILDVDLAALYGVPVKRLNEQVKRNAARFPTDFLFRLSRAEYQNLRSQIATSSYGHGGRRYLPRVFTEHGAVMAANVLNSERAIKMSILVVRAFVRVRESLAVNQRLLLKLSELEQHIQVHDAEIEDLIDALRELTEPLPANHRRIGFELPPGAKEQKRLDGGKRRPHKQRA